MSMSDFRASTAVKTPKRVTRAIWGLYSPAEYHKRHRALNRVDHSSSLGELFSNGRAQHSVPIVDRKPREILTGMWSFDSEVLTFLRDSVAEWNKKLPVDLDRDGFTRTGIHASFDKLRCPAGYLQTPMSAKVVDNALLRESMGLTAGYSPNQRRIARMVWRAVWSRAAPSAVNVPKASAGGMRRFTHDVQWKLDYALWKTRPETYDKYLHLVEGADVYGLANEYEIVFGMYVQKRLQLDEPSKVRLANDWEYAVSGGRHGSRNPTDKRVVIDGKEWSDFSALRVRVIDAGPWAINCDLQIVATAHMRAMFHDYPKTFHVNTADQMTELLNGKHIFCSDVSEYDQSMSKDAIAVAFETMRERYPEGIVRAAERLYAAPYYAKPLNLGGKEGKWIFDPMDWTKGMNSGNRSGHAMTSLVAKVNKVIETLFLLDLMYGVSERNLSSWLRGEMMMGLVNNGDDEVVWAQAKKDIDRFKQLRSDLSLGHYDVKPEVGMGFSGNLLVRENPDELVYKPMSRLQTPIEKCYVPERSIGGVLRPYWPIGWLDRIDALHKSDAGRELWSIHNFYYDKHLKGKYGSHSAIIERGLRGLPIQTHELSEIDREVLVDPDKLHYKYTDDQISKDVRALITSNIPAAYCDGFLRRYYSGTTI